jgi:cytochrome c oxidase assembly protein Cox11
MNNVIIDDRRIQVDFSQSVSKLMPKNHKPNQPQQKMVK